MARSVESFSQEERITAQPMLSLQETPQPGSESPTSPNSGTSQRVAYCSDAARYRFHRTRNPLPCVDRCAALAGTRKLSAERKSASRSVGPSGACPAVASPACNGDCCGQGLG